LSESKNEKVKLKCFLDAETLLELMLLRADLIFSTFILRKLKVNVIFA
jgi:hypothetical protein